MTNTRLLISSFFSLVSPAILFSQAFFQKTYDNNFSDKGNGVEVLPNGDIIVCGSTAITDPAGAEFMLIYRLDDQGEMIWSKVFNDNNMAVARDIAKSADGNLIVAYNTGASTTVGGWMKISTDGDVIWSKNASIPCSMNKITPLASGGYLLSGVDQSNSMWQSQALAMKITETGDVAWVARFGGIGDDEFTGCWEDDQGFIYCTGYSSDFDLNRDGHLAKISPAGSVLWARRYGIAINVDEFANLAPFSENSDLLLAGHSVSLGFEYDKILLVRVTSAGELKWARSYELPDLDIAAVDVLAVPGDQFLISAANRDNGLGSPAVLMKISKTGDMLWKYEYKTGGERAVFREILPVAGGFVAAGSAVRNGDENFYLIKIASDGLIPASECCPAFVDIERKDVVMDNEPYTPVTTVGFLPLSTLVVATDAGTETTNLCTPIDLEFSVSDTSICAGECVEIEITGNTPSVTYSLSTNGGEPDPNDPDRICYPANGNYAIIRTGFNGVCTKELSRIIEVGTRPDAFANAFTPNGDGVNDTYKPLFFCPVISTRFSIYNRWGQKVFETQDPDKGWDGKTDGKEAPSDVYTWQVEYEAVREGVRQKLMEKGDVALLR